jgi:hypothetical protein
VSRSRRRPFSFPSPFFGEALSERSNPAIGVTEARLANDAVGVTRTDPSQGLQRSGAHFGLGVIGRELFESFDACQRLLRCHRGWAFEIANRGDSGWHVGWKDLLLEVAVFELERRGFLGRLHEVIGAVELRTRRIGNARDSEEQEQ